MPARPASLLQLQIIARAGREMQPFLRRHVPAAAALAAQQLRELSIVLVGDTTISALHQRYFDDPATTDVITFPLELNARGNAISGELYNCAPMARRQAARRRVPPTHELLLYAVHGMLHLSGHDDRTSQGYQKMHRTEDTILSRLGIGPVFARPAADVKARSLDGK
jgi:probable rRNA maturation factor